MKAHSKTGKNMPVSEAMTENPETCGPESPLPEVARKMIDRDCGAIPVVEDGALVGIVTDRDIATRAVASGRNPLELTAKDVMTPHVATVTPETLLEECCNVMEREKVRRVPVVDEKGDCLGIVAQADVVARLPGREAARVLEALSR